MSNKTRRLAEIIPENSDSLHLKDYNVYLESSQRYMTERFRENS